MIKDYKLSLAADGDLNDIFDYSEIEFGFEQAVKYISEFEDVLNRLVANPEQGRRRNEIKPGLRSYPNDSHVIFYRIMKDHLRVVRVLHEKRDYSRLIK